MGEAVDAPQRAEAAPPQADGARRLSITVLAGLSLVLGVIVGWRTVVEGLLSQSDAYQRVSRLIASYEAGHILDHIPRDNAGTYIALHWSHLLDAIIVLLALPLVPFVGVVKALHYGGAMIGPLSLFFAALATVVAVERICGQIAHAAVVGAMAIMGPPIIAYGALGQADHHVLMGALAIACPAFAYTRAWDAGEWRTAALGGSLAALGTWVTPEMVPFALFGWATAILCDVEAKGGMDRRTIAFAAAQLIVLVLAFAIDPPAPERFAAEADRLSLPFVELGLLMLAIALLASRFAPRLQGSWPPAILAGAIVIIGLSPWAVLHPELLRGPSGIFSEASQARVWKFISEMRPLNSLQLAFGLGVFPTAALIVTIALMLWRRISPLAVLVAGMVTIVIVFAWLHLRFAVYLHLAAATAIGVVLGAALLRLPAGRPRRIAALAAMFFGVAPFVAMAIVPRDEKIEARGACSIQKAAAALDSQAGRVVLTELNYAPALIYFTRAIAVAGPYHRSEKLIIALLDSWREPVFKDAMPASFAATHAQSVLVCRNDDYPPGSLGAALAAGETPAWLRELPMPAESNFRLLEVR